MDFETSGALFSPFVQLQTTRSLARTRALLAALGNPHEQLRFVHIAGTNGKGSTAAMLAAILQKAGYRTGLYTSPALRRFNERIQVNGSCMGDDALKDLAARAGTAALALPAQGLSLPNEFELVTAVALAWFAAVKCELVVLEVGLGGRWDPTNVIQRPEAVVICPIGMDHMAVLGSTLAAIAGEKAGILKPGCPAVLAAQEREAGDALLAACGALGIAPVQAGTAQRLAESLEGQGLNYKAWQGLTLPLLGDYQLQNAATVLETIEVLRQRGWAISDAVVAAGLETVRWPARLDVLRKHPPVVLDGAHNAHGVASLARSLTALFGEEKLTLVAGILADKDYDQMLGLMACHAKRLFLVPPPSPRALSAADAQAAARRVFPGAVGFHTVEAGLDAAMAAQREDRAPVVCFGSLYMAGTVLDYFQEA